MRSIVKPVWADLPVVRRVRNRDQRPPHRPRLPGHRAGSRLRRRPDPVVPRHPRVLHLRRLGAGRRRAGAGGVAALRAERPRASARRARTRWSTSRGSRPTRSPSPATSTCRRPAEHDVFVNLKLFIPYIVTAHGVLMIDESLETQMTGVSPMTELGRPDPGRHPLQLHPRLPRPPVRPRRADPQGRRRRHGTRARDHRVLAASAASRTSTTRSSTGSGSSWPRPVSC